MAEEEFVSWECDPSSVCQCSGCFNFKFIDNWPSMEKIDKWNKKRVHFGKNYDE